MGVGIIGFGTIGTGGVRLLRENGAALGARVGTAVKLVRVADLDTRRSRGIKLARGVLIRDARRLIADPEVDIVIELVGGIEPARSFILEAMRAGKSVITANKALLSLYGPDLAAAAEKNGVAFGFEAAIGGGIPIVRTLREALVGDHNQEVYGIVNGTANYILSAMSDGAGEFAEVLARAQKLGLAEADPSYDVDGIDSLHKLVVLVALAFGKKIRPDAVHVEGIRKVNAADIAYAKEFGYAIRLLAVARETSHGIEARVHPAMVPRSHLLADVSGAFNAICLRGKALGTSVYYGQGAGMMPTATAVLADIMEAAGTMTDDSANRVLAYGQPVEKLRAARVVPMGQTTHEYYIRFKLADKPGVLARISRILGTAGISIATVAQNEASRRGSVPVVIRTHLAREASMRRALARVVRLKDSRAQPVVIRVEEALGGQD